MRKSLLVLALAAPFVFGQTQTFTYSYSGLPLPIYPDDWNTVTAISLMVPRSLTVSKVTATLNLQYSGVGDLNVFLFSAAGTRSKLLERNCSGLVNVNATFDDSASSKFSDACPNQAGGTYRGNEPLSNSNGENAFGFWRIAVENNGSSRTGSIVGFSVSITGTVLSPPFIGPNTIVSTANLQGGSIAPGDQISVIGVNLGPSDGVRADASKALPTTLGQTTVTFDGVAAPMYYASDNLVQVQAPFSLNAATTKIQVQAASGTSSAVTLPVVPTNPGILTYDATGQGQARALNQDGSLNGDGSITGSDHAASVGTVLQVYTTGLGAVTPAISAGTPAPSSPLSTVSLPVTASIGGRSANVLFAGAAPGLIGVYQVNVVVPALAPTGAARLVISVDNNASQAGVTVQIR